MEPKVLKPRKRTIDIRGKLSYRETLHAWSLIWLKKELVNEFPDLMEKRSEFSYKMLFYQNYKELGKAIRVMKKGDKPLPILLFLVKEREANF